MPTVICLDPAGVRHEIEIPSGQSLMEGVVRSGLPGLLGECGGNLSCATCHVYIDDAWSDRVGRAAAGSFEDELLDNVSAERLSSSRLSCQVMMTADLQGLTVRLAPRQT